MFTWIVSVDGFSESSCPENLTWSEGEIRTCVSFCCAPGKRLVDGWDCVDDNDASGTFLKIGNFREEDLHPIVDNPCRYHWMSPSVITDFHIDQNGSITGSNYDGGSLSDLQHYCVFRIPGSAKLFAKVCRAWVRKSSLDIITLVTSMLVMMIIFIGFTITPELRNLHGLIFRCYVATYIAVYICAIVAEFITQNRTLPLFFFGCFGNLIWYDWISMKLTGINKQAFRRFGKAHFYILANFRLWLSSLGSL